MSKTSEKKQVVAMSEETATKCVEAIDKQHAAIGKGYLAICGKVARLKAEKGYEVLGYKNIYDLTAERWQMSRGTTSQLCQIYDRFGNGEWGLSTEKVNGRGMVALLDVIKEEKAAKADKPIVNADSDEVKKAKDMTIADEAINRETVGSGAKESTKIEATVTERLLAEKDVRRIAAWLKDEVSKYKGQKVAFELKIVATVAVAESEE